MRSRATARRMAEGAARRAADRSGGSIAGPRARGLPLDRHARSTRPGASSATIDLHTHTTRSDGRLSPVELVAAAAQAGIRMLSITDHDTLAAHDDLGASAGPDRPAGIELISGVEINSVAPQLEGLWEGELHILGLGVRLDDPAFRDALVLQRAHRRDRFGRTIARLAEIGLPVDDLVGELGANWGDHESSLGRPAVARLLVSKGYVSSVEEAFRGILGRGGPGYLPRVGLGPREAITLIRGAGGLAVLAHFGGAAARPDLVRELVEHGLGGLEVYYATFEPDSVSELATIASTLGLVPTGGTDYHGDTGTYAEAHAALAIPEGVGESVRRAVGASAASAPRPIAGAAATART